MSVGEFMSVVNEIRPFTDYIYLHVLGEPFLHPHFREILQIASAENLKVNISTNGSLLHKYFDFLMENPVRQLNISLHDAEENVPKEKWSEFILSMLEIAKSLSSDFNFVRVDLFDINGKPYIGEMTFTPHAGRITSMSDKALLETGKFLKIDKKEY